MVLNQRQVFVIVSDWEPYLGSLFGVVFFGVIVLSILVPVSVLLCTSIRLFRFSWYVYCFCI